MINKKNNKWAGTILRLFVCLSLSLSLAAGVMVSTVQADQGVKLSNEYHIDTFDDDGEEIDMILVPGGPSEDTASTAELPKRGASGSNILSSVPAFDWSYGCSATSAAMMFGYYDNQGYENMYDGPANDGDCPMTNSVWGSGECPLSATRQGLDGLETKGHVDDYWSSLGSSSDPYYGNWDESGYADCTADFMGTNQYNNFNASDGGTFFFFKGDGSPLYDYTACEPSYRDGSHGMRLFAESRGYEVETNFSQYIKGIGSNPDKGFSFADFQEEIDSGRPVMIQVAGHSMVGFGYSEPDNVYIHNTWDYNDHSMTWGGRYYGMQHYGVSVLRLESTEPTPEPEPEPEPELELPAVSTAAAASIEQQSATLNGVIDNDGGESCQVRFEYGTNPGEPYAFNTDWSGNLNTGDDFSQVISDLSPNTIYYFRAQTKNSAGSSNGAELSFTSLSVVLPEAPASLTAIASGSQQINLSWTRAADADKTKIQRKQGGFPVDINEGTEIYFGNAEAFSDTELSPETSYYYRAWSFSDGSALWSGNYAESQATTEVIPNNPPNVPTTPSPETLSANVSVEAVLNWYGDDPDEGDSLTYNVYFDTVDASTLVASSQSSTSFEPGNLENDSAYFWKVVSTDSHGMSVESPVWKFNTEPAESTPLTTSYDINLSAGWNLISLPLIPKSSDINDIINSANLASGDVGNVNMVYHYNTSSDLWDYWSEQTGGTLQSMNDGNGYWIYTRTADVLTISGLEATTASYDLQSNWNMLGFTSVKELDYNSYLAGIGDSCSVLYGWDATTSSWYCPTLNQNGGNLEPGHGYWAYMSAPGTVMLS